MRVGIDVNNRQEADAVQRSLEDPLLKTVLMINGLLNEIEDVRARERVLHLVNTVNEPQFTAPRVSGNGGLGRIHDAGSSSD